MKGVDLDKISADDWDEMTFPRPEKQEFDEVVERAISRRGFLGGVVAFGSGAAVMGTVMLKGSTALAQQETRFPSTPIPAATDGTVHVPEGYSWQRLISWGDPLFSDAVGDFNSETGGSVEMSDRVFGENTDGMWLFTVDNHQIIAANHEYTNRSTNLPQAENGTPRDADDVLKLQNLQGVSIFEVTDGPNGWEVVIDSSFNHRITHNTPMRISGPAAGHELLQTEADPTGTESLGTMNNCGSGPTPRGTYLTCEENWNGYFGSTEERQDQKPVTLTAEQERYGIGVDGWGYGYHLWDARFDVHQNPNEPHRVGYIVEIDPADPESTPIKRTALDHFKHENAANTIAPDGRVVVYMGDDERGEFMYKWVSRDVYVPGGDTSTLLEEGQIFAAKFHDDGTGEWLALTPEVTGMSEAEIAIFTRIAASQAGATTMDRPEWIAVNPVAAEGYCALTNNRNRGVRNKPGGDWQAVGGPNPRPENHYGQIVRWYPEGQDHASDAFAWDLYVMCGNPEVHEDAYAGSENIHAGNLFNSPDGMMFDSVGMLWIQTDGDDDNEGDFVGMGNNQMLLGDPASGQIERFLTGPNGCEVTGLCWSADRRTMFVGIQHPSAPFPDGEGELPRSSIIAVRRDDNAMVG